MTDDTDDGNTDDIIPATHEWTQELADAGTPSRPTYWISRTHSQHWIGGPDGEKYVPVHVVIKSHGEQKYYIMCADCKLADAVGIVDALRAVAARTHLQAAHRLAQIIHKQLGDQPTTRQLAAVADALGVDLAALAWTYDGCLGG